MVGEEELVLDMLLHGNHAGMARLIMITEPIPSYRGIAPRCIE